MNWSKTMLFASAAALAFAAASAQAQNMPKKIGYVTNYATHEWYQNVIKGMTSMVAIFDYDSGYFSGVEAGKYSK